MADQQTPEISETDVDSLAQKLEQFNQTLTPGEQAALAEVIRHAMPQDEDVEGFGYKTARVARIKFSPTLVRTILGLHRIY